MGLDMHFEKEIYIGAAYGHRKITGTIDISEDGNHIEIDFNKVSAIIESVGYLRKANAIHGWLVKNIQDEIDECQRAYFSEEKRKELLLLCRRVLKKDKEALEELSPASGFFFGRADQDEWYYQNVEEMIEILEPLQNNRHDIYYQASW